MEFMQLEFVIWENGKKLLSMGYSHVMIKKVKDKDHALQKVKVKNYGY